MNYNVSDTIRFCSFSSSYRCSERRLRRPPTLLCGTQAAGTGSRGGSLPPTPNTADKPHADQPRPSFPNVPEAQPNVPHPLRKLWLDHLHIQHAQQRQRLDAIRREQDHLEDRTNQ